MVGPPVALVEVQGYVYMAKAELAEFFRRVGEKERGVRLLGQAEQLRNRFNEDFWLKDKGTVPLALQSGGKLAAVVASNPGHALWAGIVNAEKAKQTVEFDVLIWMLAPGSRPGQGKDPRTERYPAR